MVKKKKKKKNKSWVVTNLRSTARSRSTPPSTGPRSPPRTTASSGSRRFRRKPGPACPRPGGQPSRSAALRRTRARWLSRGDPAATRTSSSSTRPSTPARKSDDDDDDLARCRGTAAGDGDGRCWRSPGRRWRSCCGGCTRRWQSRPRSSGRTTRSPRRTSRSWSATGVCCRLAGGQGRPAGRLSSPRMTLSAAGPCSVNPLKTDQNEEHTQV